KEQLPFYNQPTILWIAPTCDALPTSTSSAYHGDTVTFRVKASQKRRALGKGAVKVGYGRLGAITAYINEDDGIGQASIPSELRAFLSARLGPLTGMPVVDSIEIDDGSGGTTESKPGKCPDATYDACATAFYDTVAMFRVTAQAMLHDGSALCDANTISV